MERTYIAIDLKSFYASVECVARHLDPLTTHLVVADESRTDKTICLAVSPALKAYGIPGRARLFEVVQKVKEINAKRRASAPERKLKGSSCFEGELSENPALSLDYIVAPPQMELYEKISARVFEIYGQYVSFDDIHVYSIDEVFMDVTDYLKLYHMTAHELAMTIIRAVLSQTGITATAGIGPNLYLCKVAMDIMAKRIPADRDGVRIAELDEMSYRKQLWTHTPLTDFWRVGRGYAKKLASYGLYTMGDIARCSLKNEGLLYKLFGVNAELLIDHAWGWEPCTIPEIKAYKPESNSLGSGQVLQSPYSFEKGKLVAREMADLLVLEMAKKGLMTDQIVLGVSYDTENLKDPERRKKYSGEIVEDGYGRPVPKPAHGSVNLERYTDSAKSVMEAVSALYDRIVDRDLLVRKIYLTANRVVDREIPSEPPRQLDLFTDYRAEEAKEKARKAACEKERRMQETVLSVHEKFGKNALVRGMDLEEGATTRDRNNQIGGHRK